MHERKFFEPLAHEVSPISSDDAWARPPIGGHLQGSACPWPQWSACSSMCSRVASRSGFVDTATHSRIPIPLAPQTTLPRRFWQRHYPHPPRTNITRLTYAFSPYTGRDKDPTATRHLDDSDNLQRPEAAPRARAPRSRPLSKPTATRRRTPRSAGGFGRAERGGCARLLYCGLGTVCWEIRGLLSNLAPVDPLARVAAHPPTWLRARLPPAGEGISRW